MNDDVHKITIEMARPRGTFPGRVETGYYCVADGFVILTDEQGRPVGDKQRVGDGDPRLIACMMLRQRKRLQSAFSDFSAPISYRKTKYL
jgi:hypothetical protein